MATIQRSKALQDQKLARARLIAEQLAKSPFVRLIALGNSVAMGMATELSDLDLFVVTAPNRLYTARFWLLARAKWLGFTKRPGKLADQADLGFWVDETALDLSSIALRSQNTSQESRRRRDTSEVSHPRIDDPYLTLWLWTLIPLASRSGTYEQLIAANRSLLKGSPPLQYLEIESGGIEVGQSWTEWLLGGWFGNLVEFALFGLQRWKVWRDPVAHQANSLTVNGQRVDVVTTPHMLKLHHLDQREKLRDWARSRLNIEPETLWVPGSK